MLITSQTIEKSGEFTSEADDTTEGEGELETSYISDLLVGRKNEIRAFAVALRNESLISHVTSDQGEQAFHELICLAINDYGVAPKHIAAAVSMNVSSIGRWVAGTSFPPQLSREAILKAIAVILDHDIDISP